ncbi:HAMP domain-containing sensor histidine kinase [Acidovorax lacteus]|uniref:histidine kinase n=2 Tax=Acidovorax lacteus TaxID=1924988 RepID=A0ABP8LC87_9BURK
MQAMFRRRLSWVLIVLAACVVLQGLGAVWALREAERQVVRGRIASDILQRFVELSATKQRLRSWLTQHQIGAGGDLAERDALELRMRTLLDELLALAQAATAAGLDAADRSEHEARTEALQVLRHSVNTLGHAIREAPPLSPDAQAGEAWDALADVFERAEGRELRPLIAQSIAREHSAMARERAAADTSLARMQLLWIGMALALALAALGATVYFGRALRRPLDALVGGAQALRAGQLQHRIALPGRDEFADVGRSMDAMAEELEQHRQREAAQRHLLEAQVRERTEDLHRANESLQRTDLRRRQLLADISHELRTPTTAIRGEAEVTLRGPDRPATEYRDALRRIVDTSRQLGSVIDDLLAMARSDLDTLSLVRERIPLQQPLDDALRQATALAAASQVHLVAQGPGADGLQVDADPQRLAQLLLLLLDNAVRYSHPGGIVHWSVQPDTAGRMVELRVQDEGIGIAPDELPQVFERHFRGAAARRHRASGSGLGLPIARALAQAHGGTLVLISPAPAGEASPAGGTCAVLSLPLARDLPNEDPAAPGRT